MTLETLIPSLRSSLYQRVDPARWPATTTAAPGADLAVGGVPCAEIAARCGTPAYVLDVADVRRRCREYRAALPGVAIAYAGKAFLCRAMAALVHAEGLGVDVCSAGELAVVLSAGVPADRVVLHGNAKTEAELAAAVAAGVGLVVVDAPDEVDRLAAVVARDPGGSGASAATGGGRVQDVALRVAPGIEAGGHRAVLTGGDDQKFGVPLAGGAALATAGRIVDRPGLRLAGLHTHLGSRIADVEPFARVAGLLLDLAAEVAAEHGVVVERLALGGGHGVDPGATLDPETFARRVPAAVRRAAALRGLPAPTLAIEPGRAIAARAGVTLYRVVSTKRSGSGRWFVAVDGGMGDNPRASLYGAAYDAHLVGRPTGAAWADATVVGRHCESGDVLARDVTLPADVVPGDLLAVPGTGAYHHAMASTYNLVPRPPVVAVEDGSLRTWVRRETVEDLLARDQG